MARPVSRRISTIDAHAGGAPLRLIVGGLAAPEGSALDEKRTWFLRHADAIRLALLREPRGHADMLLGVLTEPVDHDAAAGVLFLGRDESPDFSGHGVIAAVTIALERGLLVPADPTSFMLETPAGNVEVRPDMAVRGDGTSEGRLRVREVAYRAPPVFVAHPGLAVVVGDRRLHVDVVWSCGWYVLADREALGIPPESGAHDRFRQSALRLMDALKPSSRGWLTPDAARTGLDGVVLTGPAGRDDADLRSITVYADGTIDRSPSGAATAAVLAVLDGMGLIQEERPLQHEGPSGLTFRARIAARVQVGDIAAIVPEILGEAWITGEHEFILDAADPLVTGFDF